jgi:hypothetical protein
MYSSQGPTGFRFERRRRPLPGRLIAVGAGLLIFTLLWFLVPHGALYWLLLPLLAALVWVVTYGWRQALAALHAQLHRWELLEREVLNERFT